MNQITTECQIEYRLVRYYGTKKADALEKWLDIVYAGADGSILTFVSQINEQRTRKRAPGQRFRPSAGDWLRLKETRNENGYWRVSILRRDQKYKQFDVHRLVASAWYPECDEVACHGIWGKDDNSPQSLTWGSHAKNRADEEQLAIKQRKNCVLLQADGLEISLACQSTGWRGEMRRDGIALDLPEIPRAKTSRPRSAVSVVKSLLYQLEWFNRGVRNLRLAMPEKTDSWYGGTTPDDENAWLPHEGFRILNEECSNSKIERDSKMIALALCRYASWVRFRNRFDAMGKWIYSQSHAVQMRW